MAEPEHRAFVALPAVPSGPVSAGVEIPLSLSLGIGDRKGIGVLKATGVAN